VQLVFGKTLVFDRTVEKEGQPTMASEAIGATPAPAAAASAPAPAAAASASQVVSSK